jgi:lycopene beta-cyclase
VAEVRDVAVVGDGPAGSALAAACARRGVDVVLVGTDAPWPATYATWVDDLDGVDVAGRPAAEFVGPSLPAVTVHAERSVVLDRPYGIIDNPALRAALRSVVGGRTATAIGVESAPGRARRLCLDDGTSIAARLIVDAAGWPSQFVPASRRGEPAWQTALGVVLAEPPPGELGVPTWMDFRTVRVDGRPSSVGPHGTTTFCYSLPLADGWLVEETVLASRPAVEPIALLPRLAARLGRHPDTLLADAVRVEYVRIPMGAPIAAAGSQAIAFGAAAGYVNPVSGFSVATALRAAPRVADAIAAELRGGPEAIDTAPLADAVWPTAWQRTRALHDFGLGSLLRLDDDGVRAFFGAFFDLPQADWSTYLRPDAPPSEVARVMTALFRSASWPVRRRLMTTNPTPLVRLARR